MATLTLNFDVPSPTPLGGFNIKYRKVGTNTYTTVTPKPIASPVVITGLEQYASYEGTISSDCGSSIYSNVVNFVVRVSRQHVLVLTSTLAGICLDDTTQLVFSEGSIATVTTGTALFSDPDLNVPLSPLITYVKLPNNAVHSVSNGIVGAFVQNC